MFIKSIFKLLGKQILDSIGFTEKMGGDIGNFEINPIVKMNDRDFRDFKAELNRIDKDPVQVDILLKTHGLEQIQGLKEYILKNDVKQGSVNELIETQNFTNIANQAHGYAGVNAAINEYNNLKDKSIEKANKFAETIGKSNQNLGKYLMGLKNTTGGMGGYALSLVKATAKTIALELATTALNAVISFSASLVVSGVIKLFDSLITTSEEQAEKLQNAKQAYEDVESELQSLNDELKTTQQRMSEIESRGTLTFVEKEEYDNLVKTNNELQREIDLLEQEKKLKASEKKQNIC